MTTVNVLKRPASAVLGLAACAVLALSACGSDDNTASAGTAGTSPANSAVQCGGAESLKASGSSAQANAMTRFVSAFEAACDGQTLDYTSNGSGAGVKEFTGRQTDLGGSDSPLSKDKGEVDAARQRCDGNDAWNLPAVFGPIAITYNVPGKDLVLDAATLAKVFSGAVTSWNDPAIAALNGGAAVADQPIVVVFRNDESGTTDNFQKYLAAASGGTWTKGAGKVFNGGVGEGAKGNEGTSAAIRNTPGSITYNEWSFARKQDLQIARIVNSGGDPVELTSDSAGKAIEGAKGNEGTSAAIRNTPGSITYNEWSFARKQNLQIARIVNSGGGDPVELTSDSAGKAIEGARIEGTGNDLVLDLDSIYATTTPGAYPLVLATYEIVCSKYADAETGKAVRAFLTVAVTDGQRGLEDNGYIPVPKAFQDKLLTAVQAIG